jgi:prepilin-type N-terminal cleavage/methylation domain-containing protein
MKAPARAPAHVRGERGLTMIELMVAMVLSTLLIGAAFQIAIVVLTGYRQHREAVGIQRSARGSLDLIADAVRNGSAGVPTANLTDAAGCTDLTAVSVIDSSIEPDELTVITAAGGTVTSVRELFEETSSSITVLDGTGLAAGDLVLVTDFDKGHVVHLSSVTDNGSDWTLAIDAITCPAVDFAYSPGALVLRAKVSRFYVEDVDGVPTLFMDPDGDGSEAAEPLAEGIEDFQVAVGVDVDGDGTLVDSGDTTDEWFYNDAADGAPPDITATPWRALRLSVVARATKEDTTGTWSARPDLENHSGAADDGYRRRMVSTIVEIRNLEGSP